MQRLEHSANQPQYQAHSHSEHSVRVGESCDTPHKTEFFTHIAMHYMTPWVPTLLQLQYADDKDQKSIPLISLDTFLRNHVYLELKAIRSIKNEFQLFTLLEFLSKLDKHLTWRASLWRLSERGVPCALQGHVFVHPVEVSGILLWDEMEKDFQTVPRAPTPAAHEDLDEAYEESGRPPKRARLSRNVAAAEGVGNADNEAEVNVCPADSDSEVEEEADEQLEEPLVEEMYAALQPPPPDPVQAQPSLHVLDRPGTWGAFRFSRKQGSGLPNAMEFGCFEVTCPFHMRSKHTKSLCKKVIRVLGPADANRLEALKQARAWAVQAREYKYQYEHVFEAEAEKEWSFSELEEKLIEKNLLVRPNPDSVLDDQELLALESPEERNRRQQGRGRGRGRAGNAKGKAQPKRNRKAKVQGQSAAATVEQVPADVATNACSSSENTSSSSSSSS
eukprot:5507676-Amphidinium_carterae.1